MDIEVFTICDSASDYAGRLCLLGVFDAFMTPQVPYVHPHCTVAVRIRVAQVEQGDHRLTLHIVDDDGNMIAPPLEGGFNVVVPPNERSAKINLVLNLEGLQLNRYGHFEINFAVDGHAMGTVSFVVRQPQPLQP